MSEVAVSTVVAIPARLNSTRFPRKVLAHIDGRPMLWHVYQGASKAKSVTDVWVLTDSEEVYEEAVSWGCKALMTSEECPSGTARIASVVDALGADIVVNVQGDEPMISGSVVDGVVATLEGSDADVATPVYRISEIEDLTNPNVVKVVRDANGRALYFSRSPIPYVRDLDLEEWCSVVPFWGHVGVYAYRRTVLLDYATLPDGTLEGAEKLEQLRLLEAGKQIITVEVDYRPHGVDTPADLDAVERIFNPSNQHPQMDINPKN